jgi:Zn-dependent protease with chaperone function
MDFFEHQDIARRRTWLLVALFVVAAACVVAAVGAVAAFVVITTHEDPYGQVQYVVTAQDTRFILAAAAGALGLIILGTAWKIASLGKGGSAVAELLGGRLLDPSSRELPERRLLNVVEEMAIASGLPVPPVYVLEEESINAFAAGFQPDDAVIGVTRGAIERLSRDELQGVVAHEFSHILNGDTRLNIRLMGWVFGIMLLGLIGLQTLRVLSFARFRSGRGQGGAILIALFLLGLALIVIGYIGTFFGNVMKAAVSRQREYLADASGVQYTRNPFGLAGALKKIGGFSAGSTIGHPKAAQASHMYFARGVSRLAELFSTHPPLPERIRRLDPAWDGRFAKATAQTSFADEAEVGFAHRPSVEKMRVMHSFGKRGISALQTSGSVGEAHVAYAETLLSDLDDRLIDAARKPYSARAVVYALIVSTDRGEGGQADPAITARNEPEIAATVRELVPILRAAGPEVRLPLLDLAMPALKKYCLTPANSRAVLETMAELSRADGRIDLFEWMLAYVANRRLAPERAPGANRPRHASIEPVKAQAACLVGAMAWVGAKDEGAARAAFEKAMDRFRYLPSELPPREECGLAALPDALRECARLAPKVKRELMRALGDAASHDKTITVREAEMFRAFADGLDVPVPPLLPRQKLA